jgi:hypothetical protein
MLVIATDGNAVEPVLVDSVVLEAGMIALALPRMILLLWESVYAQRICSQWIKVTFPPACQTLFTNIPFVFILITSAYGKPTTPRRSQPLKGL